MTYPFMTGAAKSDFGKKVAETVRGIKSDFQGGAPATDHSKVDPAVREQINTELDGLIKKHEGT